MNLILNFQNSEVIGSKLQTEEGMSFDYNTEYFLVLLLWASGSQAEMILDPENTWKYLEKYLIVISGEVQLK